MQICERCGFRVNQAEPFPRCDDCWDHVCEGCMAIGTDYDVDGHARCLCVFCQDAEEEEIEDDWEVADEPPDEEAKDVDFG